MAKKNIKQPLIYLGLVLVGLVAGLLLNRSGSTPNVASKTADHEHEDSEEIWTCSMHPQIRQDGPGKCPLCAMDLIPLSGSNDTMVGDDEIQMTETSMKMANIQTFRVGKSTPQKEIFLQGKVVANERNMATVTAHFNGRVEKLYADFTGQFIRKGQKLATLYSPDLVTAQKELFEALKFKDSNPAFYDAAVQKLKLWELTDGQIKDIVTKGQPQFYFNVYAPRSGTILVRRVSEGEHVAEGKVLFELADLDHLWVQFDVYEMDLPWISVGDSISFKVHSIPDQVFISVVTFVDPVINQSSRTATVRVEINNAQKQLKPQMFVEGIVRAKSKLKKEVMLVPKTAVLWTGKRSIVYVKRSQNQPTFQFREIELGAEAGDFYIALDGISEGDEVVTNGVFKVDAAAQLQGKTSMMNTPSQTNTSLPNTQTNQQVSNRDNGLEESSTAQAIEIFSDIDPTFKSQLKSIFQQYLPVKNALVETDAKAAQGKAEALMESIVSVDMSLVNGSAHEQWMKDLKALTDATQTILQTSDVEKIRIALSPLSDQLYNTLTKFGVKTGGFRQFCPMAFDFKGAFWLSDSDEVFNPYFGDEMLHCGSVEEELQ